jgi:hypothetical protein
LNVFIVCAHVQAAEKACLRFPFESTMLAEVTLSSPPHSGAASGLVIRSKTACCNKSCSPRAVAEDGDLRYSKPVPPLVLAADDSDQHAMWVKFLSQKVSMSNASCLDTSPTSSDASSVDGPTVSFVTPDTAAVRGTEKPAVIKLTMPPRSLLLSLIQGNFHEELADRLCEARRALLSSRHNFKIPSTTDQQTPVNDAPAQAALHELQAALLGCSRRLNSTVDDEIEPIVVDWLQSLSLFVEKCLAAYDEVLMGRGGNFYGGMTALGDPVPSWSVTAQTAAYILQDIEFALREGYRDILKNPRRPLVGQTAAMGYWSWWARKKTL